jgi:hypothetical protein
VNAARPLEPKKEWHVLNTFGRLVKGDKDGNAARRGMAARQRQIIAEQKAKDAKKKGKK